MRARSNLESAKNNLLRIKNSEEELKVKFLNQQAYEFDNMKYNSSVWGLLFATVLNLTVFRHTNNIRKAAVFVTLGHLFGHLSYYNNLDRYFDSVYTIYEQDAVKYAIEDQLKESSRVL